MHEKTYLRKLKKFIDSEYHTQREAATEFGVSPQVLCPVMKGRKRNRPMTNMFGYKIVKKVTITYEPIEGEEQWF